MNLKLPLHENIRGREIYK